MITASSICYYGPNHKEIITEDSYPLKSYFYNLYSCIEKTADLVKNYGTRHCIIRLGVVVGRSGGFFKKILLPFYCGIGAKYGNGLQNFSWIHIIDVIKSINYLIDNSNAVGAYNACSPNYINNLTFNEILKKSFKRKILLNFSKFFIKFFFKEMGEELLLGNYQAVPQKLLDSKFIFEYPSFEDAVNITQKKY